MAGSSGVELTGGFATGTAVGVKGAFAAGTALYERLWALPDARLRAGGLSSAEVLESLAELQRRLRSRLLVRE